MEIIVGKQGNQPFAINDSKVSRQHLKITEREDGKYLIEDLGSTNGTFVDGLRIIKKVVTADTIIQLGSSFSFCIKEVVAKSPLLNNGGGGDISDADKEIIKQFAHLEQVYNDYLAEKIAIQKDNAQKSFLRMVPMSIMGLFGIVITLIPQLGEFRGIIGLLVIGTSSVLMYKAYNSQSSLPEKMEELNRRFQVNYVCPKCKGFLGYTPFEGLKNREQCPMCKTKWIIKE